MRSPRHVNRETGTCELRTHTCVSSAALDTRVVGANFRFCFFFSCVFVLFPVFRVFPVSLSRPLLCFPCSSFWFLLSMFPLPVSPSGFVHVSLVLPLRVFPSSASVSYVAASPPFAPVRAASGLRVPRVPCHTRSSPCVPEHTRHFESPGNLTVFSASYVGDKKNRVCLPHGTVEKNMQLGT